MPTKGQDPLIERLIADLLSPESGYLWASMEILRGQQGLYVTRWAPPEGVPPGAITQATLRTCLGLPPQNNIVLLPGPRVKHRRTAL